MTWNILVVDDSPQVRADVRSALEERGVEVTEAENGSEGLWRAKDGHFDVVITDVHMPMMDGLKLIKELRADPAYGETPIFVMTTDASEIRAEEGTRAGATAWAVKPLDPDFLWKGIQKALSASS